VTATVDGGALTSARQRSPSLTGAVQSRQSTITVASATDASGTVDLITLTARDLNSNPITSGRDVAFPRWAPAPAHGTIACHEPRQWQVHRHLTGTSLARLAPSPARSTAPASPRLSRRFTVTRRRRLAREFGSSPSIPRSILRVSDSSPYHVRRRSATPDDGRPERSFALGGAAHRKPLERHDHNNGPTRQPSPACSSQRPHHLGIDRRQLGHLYFADDHRRPWGVSLSNRSCRSVLPALFPAYHAVTVVTKDQNGNLETSGVRPSASASAPGTSTGRTTASSTWQRHLYGGHQRHHAEPRALSPPPLTAQRHLGLPT